MALGDFPEDTAHDFAAARLGQAGGELNFLRRSVRADVGADVLHDLGGHCASNFLPGFERDVGVNGVALDVMLVADDGGLSYSRVAADGALDFGGAEVVAADDDDVVHAAGNPVVAVVIAAAAVTAEIFAGEP